MKGLTCECIRCYKTYPYKNQKVHIALFCSVLVYATEHTIEDVEDQLTTKLRWEELDHVNTDQYIRDLCPVCLNVKKTEDKLAQTGMKFSCKECGKQGTVSATPLIQELRKQIGIPEGQRFVSIFSSCSSHEELDIIVTPEGVTLQ